MLASYICSIKALSIKVSYSFELQMFLDGLLHINVLIFSCILLKFTLLKAINSDKVKKQYLVLNL